MKGFKEIWKQPPSISHTVYSVMSAMVWVTCKHEQHRPLVAGSQTRKQ